MALFWSQANGFWETTTLYASLNELNRPDTKIITAEDPVEYYLSGINQVEVKHKIGLDFARVIRAMLRQAPNVILLARCVTQKRANGHSGLTYRSLGIQYLAYQ